MSASRRLYLYAISGITLALLGGGLTALLDAMFRTVVPAGKVLSPGAVSFASQVSQGVALVAVGLPAWLIHWWFIARATRPGGPSADAERGAALRAVYLTIVLVVALVVAIGALEALLGYGIGLVADSTSASDEAPVGTIAPAIVAAAIWLFHWLVRHQDEGEAVLDRAAAWVPRVYFYGAAFIGMTAAVQAIVGLVDASVGAVLPGSVVVSGGQGLRDSVVRASASALILGAVWLGHWGLRVRMTRRDDPAGASERGSLVRLAYFVIAIGITAGAALGSLAGASSPFLAAALGTPEAPGSADDLFRAAAIPVVGATLWAGLAALHLAWFRKEASSSGVPDRPAMVERLVSYPLSFIGLETWAGSLTALLGLALGSAIEARPAIAGTVSPQAALPALLPALLLGAGLWLWQWGRILRRRAADPREAISAVRRTMLYVVLAGSVLTMLFTGAAILSRSVGAALDSTASAAAAELLGDASAFLLAAAIGLYHGLLLRDDQRTRNGVVRTNGASPIPAEAL